MLCLIIADIFHSDVHQVLARDTDAYDRLRYSLSVEGEEGIDPANEPFSICVFDGKIRLMQVSKLLERQKG